ncbi:hypothetical protein FBU59_000614 [Linderina macrospora]|uniref:Uncharacterized protein n=1 Tax=Linderina macrospora TaxID=4868 RepID=A0ACC1JG52_9FUNG|nr:hypothetical protein FBU59_000614 [Linderina macrospora]
MMTRMLLSRVTLSAAGAVDAFNNNFDRVSNCANFNENTLYANNINANQACDAVHANTNTFNSFRKRCGCGGTGCSICSGRGGYGYPYYGGYGWGGYGGFGWPGYWY